MAGIPTNFQSISPVLANYNFVDLVSGTGYIKFYAGSTSDLNLLSNFEFYSNNIVETSSRNGSSYALVIEKSYDCLLNRPLDINGLGMVNLPFHGNSGGSNNGYAYATVSVLKWNGSTETLIATNDSYELACPSGAEYYRIFAIDLNIPLTHFKIGEYLRLKIQVYSRENTGNMIAEFAHDPMGRMDDGIDAWDTVNNTSSVLLFLCPVRLNL